MPDGSLLEGTQGSVDQPLTESALEATREIPPETIRNRGESAWVLTGVPWIMGKEKFLGWWAGGGYVKQLAVNHPRDYSAPGRQL